MLFAELTSVSWPSECGGGAN